MPVINKPTPITVLSFHIAGAQQTSHCSLALYCRCPSLTNPHPSPFSHFILQVPNKPVTVLWPCMCRFPTGSDPFPQRSVAVYQPGAGRTTQCHVRGHVLAVLHLLVDQERRQLVRFLYVTADLLGCRHRGRRDLHLHRHQLQGLRHRLLSAHRRWCV